jgi:chromosomal replication initiation ATPase DnaA
VQVPLNLRPTVAYDGKNFVEHSGVLETVNIIKQSEKGLFLVQGKPRSGKTHLLISLMNSSSRYIESRLFDRFTFCQNDFVLLDDFDLLLRDYQNDTGLIVSFLEEARNSNSKVVASLTNKGLDLEPHVGSRVRSGVWLTIGDPEESEIPKLFDSLARQRGISLEGRKRQYVLSRAGRDIPSLERFLDRLVLLTIKAGKGVHLSDIKLALSL